ncbi:hypothetical protein Mic7113_2001 [Allocoleopsis franciscana PCC 7113]|uniref:Uncharacterized protein n=1 Tax=Allocoleopsis franciscana PCC 7113 TaxID=1173027 RepID=K9WC82_9CYAN|nr:hypothetical protein Mic7113_2001 [Allocoleopsis franciscana PCC 7113]
MSLLISTFLSFFQVATFVAAVLLFLAFALGLLLIQSLNQILSVTDEYEVTENIDPDSLITLSFPASFSATNGSESTMQTTSYFR